MVNNLFTCNCLQFSDLTSTFVAGLVANIFALREPGESPELCPQL